MSSPFRSSALRVFLVTCLLLLGAVSLRAQDVDVSGEDADDPSKIFQLGQDAQAKNELERAVKLYDEALKLLPEFPEAELQKGRALTVLGKLPEAEQSLRRAAELKRRQLKTDWSLAEAALGFLLVRANRDREAEPHLRRAVALDPQDSFSWLTLASLRLRAGAKDEALKLAHRATSLKETPASAWASRAGIERMAGNRTAARVSIEQAFKINESEPAAFEERAELRADEGSYAGAVADLQAALRARPDSRSLQSRLADLQRLAGSGKEARSPAPRLNQQQTTGTAQPPQATTVGEMSCDQLAANSEQTEKALPALECILKSEPRNAAAHARLGEIHRTTAPARALEHYRRAVEIQPDNANFATGFAAALVQARRFAEAVTLLRRVITAEPAHYAAHANLATALDGLKLYQEALIEYQWLAQAQPDKAVVYFLIARDHDLLGEFEPALAAYEKFLAQADPRQNQLEMEKVELRLPSLRNQIKRGLGVKKKKASR
ncbi:MAG: tetratricopeptide repeat protein [Acidobacteriota bacterium]|nr:tetratricopeptide repeat protein [Acidobacteriota bacterium]